METQKIVNLLGDSDNEENGMLSMIKITDYGEGNEDSATVKFETKVIKSNLYDYSNAYILVTGDITATDCDANTRVAFKNCALFTKCISHINDKHVDTADNLDIVQFD